MLLHYEYGRRYFQNATGTTKNIVAGGADDDGRTFIRHCGGKNSYFTETEYCVGD